MGFVIGDIEGASTWATLRRVIGQVYDTSNYSFPTVKLAHNIEYPDEGRFKSASPGYGLVKGAFSLSSPSDQPGISNRAEPTMLVFYLSSPPSSIEVGMQAFDIITCDPQLSGETVTHGGGTYAIDPPMFVSLQVVPGTIVSPITAVGKLTPIT
jgi:hypothetical protein